jgi:beta,beta-carotene 9',10'-dioxygenase
MTNPFALGYSSLNEEIALDRLPVTGTIPAWLTGSLLRNGPAKFEVGTDQVWHWFDGLAMLHRFSFQNGNVSYANKFVQSDAYKTSMQEGRIAYALFAADPCKTRFRSSMSDLVNPNVSINKIAGEFVAMTEVPLPIAFAPDTLDTLGVVHYEDQVGGHHTSAHPHYDAANKTTISYMTEFGLQSVFKIFGIKDGDAHSRVLIGSYPTDEPSYIHSFSISEQYVIIAEYPFRVSPFKLVSSNQAFIQNFEWHAEQPAQFVVMSKQDGSIVGRYEGEAFFSFHHINAFERDGELIVDLSAYPDAAVINEATLAELRAGSTADEPRVHSEFRRYHLPLRGQSRTATYERVTPYEIELPTINYAHYNGRAYRFAYGISTAEDAPEALAHQLVCVDVERHESRLWSEDGCYPGEPVFVQAPDGRGENDGVVLSVVLNTRKGNSFLLVLDAHTFEELGRAEVPHHIPLGLHGQYFPVL